MKKILAMALVVAMVLAIVPTTFAAAKAEKNVSTECTMDRTFEQKALNANGEFVNVTGTQAKEADLTKVSDKYLSATFTRDGGIATQATLDDVETIGYAEIPLDEGGDVLYAVENTEKNGFYRLTDFYTDGTPCYVHQFAPTADQLVKSYAKGETVFFNLDIVKSFSNDGVTEELPELEDGTYKMDVYAIAGPLAEDGQTINTSIIGDWTVGSDVDCSMNLKLTAPEDDYCFFFLVAVTEVKDVEDFTALLYISSTPDAADFKSMPKAAETMTVGKTASTVLGSKDTKLVIGGCGSSYVATYAQAHKIELEGGKHYVLEMNSADNLGGTVWFCDANMNIINNTWISAGALEAGYTYENVAMAMWPTESGTYYLVAAGYWMTDEGNLDMTVYNWNDFEGADPIDEVNDTINLDELGEEEVMGTDDNWGYAWLSEDKVGMLVVAYPGTYTLTGDASDTFVIVMDGVKLVYDNAKTAAIQLSNDFAPVSIQAKGSATIADNNLFGQAIANQNGCNSGLYITGDTLTISGMFGIILENASVTLAAKKLVVDTTSAEGYFPIAIWVIGKDDCTIALGGEAKFDGSNQVSEIFYDASMLFHHGYTVSAYKELYRYDDNGTLEGSTLKDAVIYFELTTNGTIGGGASAGLLGDANEDGVLNTGDAVTVLKHAASIITLEGTGLANADYNQDGIVNTGDAVAILKYCAQA